MITDIAKHNDFRHVLEYHERKINIGTCDFMETNLYGNNTNELEREFLDVTGRRPNRQVNRCYHLSLAVTKQEHLSTKEFQELGNAYMKKFGFTNHPYLMYRHNDKDHEHIHIVTSPIDFDGNKLDSWRKKYRILDKKILIYHSRM